MTTLLGSLMSITIQIALYLFLFLKLRTMVEHGDNSYEDREEDQDLEVLGTRSYDEINLMTYFVITDDYLRPVSYDETFDNYLSLHTT